MSQPRQSLAVIAPYAAQRNLLERLLAPLADPQILRKIRETP